MELSPLLKHGPHIEPLDLKPRPLGLPEEFQARFLARMTLETVDSNELAELLETVLLDQDIEDHSKRHSVEYIVGSVVLLHKMGFR